MQGDEIKNLLNAKPGPWMAKTKQRVLEWQLEFPEATKQQCEAYVLEHQKDFLK